MIFLNFKLKMQSFTKVNKSFNKSKIVHTFVNNSTNSLKQHNTSIYQYKNLTLLL